MTNESQSYIEMLRSFASNVGLPQVDVDKLLETYRKNIEALAASAKAAAVGFSATNSSGTNAIPSSMHAEQPAELRERQLLVVDVDGDFPIRSAVVDDAAEHIAARDPLVAVLVVVDLLLARRLLDHRLVPRLQERPLRVEDGVVHFDDFGVGHLGNARDARVGEVRVGVVDDRVVPLAGDPHLINQDVGRLLRAHAPAPG
jgi:hypothetical protein